MTATTEIDLTIKDIADRCNVTPRTVNLWRSSAEQRLGRSIGYKRGKTPYFRPDEVREILKAREDHIDPQQVARESHRQASPNYHAANAQAENGILTGMDEIVASGDQNALAIGQALGQRWNSLLWTAAIQTMQSGMLQMQSQFDELHASVSIELNTQPQLGGTSLATPSLPESTNSGN